MSFIPSSSVALISGILGLLGQNRVIGTIAVNCIISEETQDVLTVTKNPIQVGTSITDHSYLEPTVLSMRIIQGVPVSFSTIFANPLTSGNNALAGIYKQFLDLQKSRTPFTVTTKKRVYENMLATSIRLLTDKTKENILALDISFQQVNIVSIGTATIPASQQSSPQVTQPIINSGVQSAALTGAQAFNPAIKGFQQ